MDPLYLVEDKNGKIVREIFTLAELEEYGREIGVLSDDEELVGVERD